MKSSSAPVPDIAILNLGTRIQSCFEAAKILNQYNINPTIADARFAKPIDTKLIDFLLDNHKFILTIEEGSSGGFGSTVLNYIHNIRIKPTICNVKNLFFPDQFIEHQSPEQQYIEIGMDSDSIAKKILNFFDDKLINIQHFSKKNKL